MNMICMGLQWLSQAQSTLCLRVPVRQGFSSLPNILEKPVQAFLDAVLQSSNGLTSVRVKMSHRALTVGSRGVLRPRRTRMVSKQWWSMKSARVAFSKSHGVCAWSAGERVVLFSSDSHQGCQVAVQIQTGINTRAKRALTSSLLSLILMHQTRTVQRRTLFTRQA